MTSVDEQAIPDEAFNLTAALYSLDDSDLVDLPTGAKASVREMTGNEQRNFMNRTKQLNGTAIQELLGACTETFNDAPLPTAPMDRTKFLLELLSGDRATLIFQIRRHSLGNDFTFGAKCPACQKEDSWEVDLSNKEDFPITPYKLGSVKVIEYDSEVRKGLKFKINLLDGNGEMAILRKRSNLHALSDLEQRSPQAFDPSSTRWIPVVLNKLPEVLITEMRARVKEHEGSIRTVVDIICKGCDSQVSFNLLEQQDFIIPNATS